jgi:hypothetical protein
VLVTNKHGENLVGLLHHTGSNKVVVLCHGFTASKVHEYFIRHLKKNSLLLEEHGLLG